MNIRRLHMVLGIGAMISLAGCQGSVPTMGTMGPLSLQNPTRVPPPADGSFQVPGQYSPQSNTTTANRPIGTGLAQAADAWHGLFKSEIQGAVGEVKNTASNISQRVNGVTQQVDQSAQNAVGAVQAGYTEASRRISDDLAPITQSLQSASESLAPPTTGSNGTWRKPDSQ